MAQQLRWQEQQALQQREHSGDANANQAER
jgi:hypothetical protein